MPDHHQPSKSNRTLKPMDFSDGGESTTAFVPPGYAVGTTPDGLPYMVPDFMVPALGLAFEAYHKKLEIGVPAAVGGVSIVRLRWLPATHLLIVLQSHEVEGLATIIIGEGQVAWPCDPVSLSDNVPSHH